VLDVVVELLSGRRFEYKFGEHMQVGFLMELVAEKMDVEWQRIQLHWNGRMLDWQKTFNAYNIQAGPVVKLSCVIACRTVKELEEELQWTHTHHRDRIKAQQAEIEDLQFRNIGLEQEVRVVREEVQRLRVQLRLAREERQSVPRSRSPPDGRHPAV
jgi:hypothetical protein